VKVLCEWRLPVERKKKSSKRIVKKKPSKRVVNRIARTIKDGVERLMTEMIGGGASEDQIGAELTGWAA